MRPGDFFLAEQLWLFHACLLQYSQFASAQSPPFSNSSSTSRPLPALQPFPSCAPTSCTIRAVPVTLTFPNPRVSLKTSSVTATVIPVIYTYPDGRRSTSYSTYQQWDSASNQTWIAPKTSDLTWETLGTILTYPTVYVAYPTPLVILNTPVLVPSQVTPTSTCTEKSIDIPLPTASTTKLIFPSVQGVDTPFTDSVFAILDNLPAVTSILGGNDPRKCFHGAPLRSSLATPIIGYEPIVHTTVAVLTQTGNPVTLAANPFGDATGNGGSPGGGELTPGGGQPQTDGSGPPVPTDIQNVGPGVPSAGNNPGNNPGGNSPGSNPVVITANGATLTVAPGGVIVGSQTLSAGNTATIANGVPISVASGGVVVVGGSSVTIPSAGVTSSSSGVGAAVASGIGATSNNAFAGSKSGVISFEAGILVLMLSGLGLL